MQMRQGGIETTRRYHQPRIYRDYSNTLQNVLRLESIGEKDRVSANDDNAGRYGSYFEQA